MQLQAIAHDLRLAILAVLAGRKVALLQRAAVGGALGTLQKEFGGLSTAEATDCSGITCHFFSLLRMTAGLRVRRTFRPGPCLWDQGPGTKGLAQTKSEPALFSP